MVENTGDNTFSVFDVPDGAPVQKSMTITVNVGPKGEGLDVTDAQETMTLVAKYLNYARAESNNFGATFREGREWTLRGRMMRWLLHRPSLMCPNVSYSVRFEPKGTSPWTAGFTTSFGVYPDGTLKQLEGAVAVNLRLSRGGGGDYIQSNMSGSTQVVPRREHSGGDDDDTEALFRSPVAVTDHTVVGHAF